MLNLAYDKQFDILYARLPFTGHSYVEEDSNFATYHNIETDSVTGVAIYSFKKKFENGSLSAIRVPIPIEQQKNSRTYLFLMHDGDSLDKWK